MVSVVELLGTEQREEKMHSIAYMFFILNTLTPLSLLAWTNNLSGLVLLVEGTYSNVFFCSIWHIIRLKHDRSGANTKNKFSFIVTLYYRCLHHCHAFNLATLCHNTKH